MRPASNSSSSSVVDETVQRDIYRLMITKSI